MFQESRYCAYPLCHSRCIIYILNPTSNHNVVACEKAADRLYIFWFLHQTTTPDTFGMWDKSCISFDSYIKPQRPIGCIIACWSCISFDSYIKPQRDRDLPVSSLVVYLLIPTSNHNQRNVNAIFQKLYIFDSYIKPQQIGVSILLEGSCISFDSYIKPQQSCKKFFALRVVYLLIPTSNHNEIDVTVAELPLYIFWFLHQTTTWSGAWWHEKSCISFDSYIKPQHIDLNVLIFST